jgi:hypothetical protein
MISRLTASAAVFAVFATAGISFASEAQQRPASQRVAPATSMPTITLPMVTVTGKRLAKS